ncbi:MAG: S-layer homology domain-containing protein, partial [Actinobacteria bacterium]|nr:S-layer homology domain-containing protein [Actinomycetota bacterium]
MKSTDQNRRRWPRLTVAIGIAVALMAVPVVAYAAFTDVPASHPFTPDINALAGAGVTTGCTPDHLNFCPSANISREAEAAF